MHFTSLQFHQSDPVTSDGFICALIRERSITLYQMEEDFDSVVDRKPLSSEADKHKPGAARI